MTTESTNPLWKPPKETRSAIRRGDKAYREYMQLLLAEAWKVEPSRRREVSERYL